MKRVSGTSSPTSVEIDGVPHHVRDVRLARRAWSGESGEEEPENSPDDVHEGLGLELLFESPDEEEASGHVDQPLRRSQRQTLGVPPARLGVSEVEL